MKDTLTLRVADLETDVLTGIYSEETGKPQPLRITIEARLKPLDRYDPDTPLAESKNYMDLRHAAIESFADHICETLFLQDERIEALTVHIIKLAIGIGSEKIGITLHRERP